MISKETVLSGAKHPGTKLRVLHSPAGFYVGFLDEDGLPYSRESDYFLTEKHATAFISYIRGKEYEPQH